MTWPAFDPASAAVAGGASLVGGFLQSRAQKRAAKQQGVIAQQTQARQIDFLQNNLDRVTNLIGPQVNAGNAATQELADLFGLGFVGGAPAGTGAGGSGSAIQDFVAATGRQDIADEWSAHMARVEKSDAKSGGSVYGGPRTEEEFLQFHLSRGGISADEMAAVDEYRNQQAQAANPDSGGSREERQQAARDRFRTSPGYEFRLDEAMDSVTGNRAVSGLLRSGDTLSALNERAQGIASDEYNSYVQGLMGIAGMGSGATGTLASAMGGTATQMSNVAGGAGNALMGAAAQRGAAQSDLWGNVAGTVAWGAGQLSDWFNQPSGANQSQVSSGWGWGGRQG